MSDELPKALFRHVASQRACKNDPCSLTSKDKTPGQIQDAKNCRRSMNEHDSTHRVAHLCLRKFERQSRIMQEDEAGTCAEDVAIGRCGQYLSLNLKHLTTAHLICALEPPTTDQLRQVIEGKLEMEGHEAINANSCSRRVHWLIQTSP